MQCGKVSRRAGARQPAHIHACCSVPPSRCRVEGGVLSRKCIKDIRQRSSRRRDAGCSYRASRIMLLLRTTRALLKTILPLCGVSWATISPSEGHSTSFLTSSVVSETKIRRRESIRAIVTRNWEENNHKSSALHGRQGCVSGNSSRSCG